MRALSSKKEDIRRRVSVWLVIMPSDNQAEFSAEMIIHFSGLKNLGQPRRLGILEAIGLFGCGIYRFTVSEPGRGRL